MKSILLLSLIAFLCGCTGTGTANVIPATNTLVSLAASSSVISENSSDRVTLTASLSAITNTAVTIFFSTSGAAAKHTDFEPIASITIAAGHTVGSTYFVPVDNAFYDGNKLATVAIALVTGSAFESGNQSVGITITDNESAPLVSLVASGLGTSEGAGSHITLTAILSSMAQSEVNVSFSTSGTATQGTDFAAIANIIIAPGSSSGTTSFVAFDDAIYESNEATTVAIASVTGGAAKGGRGSQSVAITIADNEPAPVVSLAASKSIVYDNDASLTITATTSQIADEAIIVTLATSGTAIEGSDYGAVSDITIPAGLRAGSVSFDPLEEAVYEGDEEATIAIQTLIGADALIGAASAVSITIKEYALRLETNFVEGSQASQDAITSALEWTNVDYYSNFRRVHPYEQMNIQKVQSFSDGTNHLTGEGQLIHIADFYCDTSHAIYNNKTIYNLDDGGLGESTFAAATQDDYHCQFVASMAAGSNTGDSSISGVAPDADLVLSSIPNTQGWFWTDDFAEDLDEAKRLGAVVSNNSWGLYEGPNISEFQHTIDSDPSKTRDQHLAYLLDGSSDLSSTQAYITALDSFQETGVVVFAAGNNYDSSDVEVMAGLPTFYPKLAEAWISVGYMYFAGRSIESADESDFRLQGNQCGLAKEYCVVADGTGLIGGSYVEDGVSQYHSGGSGSSYSAPMISGGIALLAQAFPNHTPEQLTDRLLASANNTWFTPQGYTTFTTHGNSITHGYHSTWGQGIPDFYAALSPIITSSNPSLTMHTGSAIQTSEAHSMSSSSLVASSAYGDAVALGLQGESTYAYDALSGGFKIDMAALVKVATTTKPVINFDRSFSRLGLAITSTANQRQLSQFNRVIFAYKNASHQALKVTIGAKTLPVQSFLASSIDPAMDISSFSTSYLNQSSGSLGMGAGGVYPIADSRLLLGFTVPIKDNSATVQNENTSITASFESDWNNHTTTTLLGGVNSNASGPLGMNGFGALETADAQTTTKFMAMKSQSQLATNIVLTTVALASNSSSTTPLHSLIGSADNIRSSSFGIGTTFTNIFGDGAVSFSVSQPDRVSSGRLNIGIPQLADSKGNITQLSKTVGLSPSGRQIDYRVSYTDTLFSKTAIKLEYAITKNANHLQDSKLIRASFIGLSNGGLKMGARLTDQEDSNQLEMRYGSRF